MDVLATLFALAQQNFIAVFIGAAIVLLAFKQMWRNGALVVPRQLARMWDEWAPVLATRTGANAVVMKLIGFAGIGLAADHVHKLVTALMVAALVWSFLRTLNGRANASGPVGGGVAPHTYAAAARDAADRAREAIRRATAPAEGYADNPNPPRGGVVGEDLTLSSLTPGPLGAIAALADGPRPAVDAFKEARPRPQRAARKAAKPPVRKATPPTKKTAKRPAKPAARRR